MSNDTDNQKYAWAQPILKKIKGIWPCIIQVNGKSITILNRKRLSSIANL